MSDGAVRGLTIIVGFVLMCVPGVDWQTRTFAVGQGVLLIGLLWRPKSDE